MIGALREDNDKIIIGGDFNVIFDPSIDRKGGNFKISKSYTEVINILDEFIDENALSDIWRKRNPLERRYTWRQKTPPIHSRLDVWLISENIEDFVKEIDIRPSVRSDHSSILLCLDSFQTERGKGYWKINNSYLDEIDYVNMVKQGVKDWVTECECIIDKRVKWEYIKYKIRLVSIEYGKKRRKKNLERESLLESELTKIYIDIEKCEQINNEDLDTRKSEIEAQLKEIENYKVEGLILRSRCNWYEKGEKSNNYFLRLVNRNKIKTTVNKLQDDNGIYTTDQQEILNRQAEYYEQLYKSQGDKEDKEITDYLNEIVVPKLSDIDRDKCEGVLLESECEEIMKTFKKGKTPGIDGLTIEFYIQFWSLIKKINDH